VFQPDRRSARTPLLRAAARFRVLVCGGFSRSPPSGGYRVFRRLVSIARPAPPPSRVAD